MRLSAFYRLLKGFPVPLVPLFKDSTGAYFAQDIDQNGVVTSFVPLLSPDQSRIVIENVPPSSPQNVGGPALYAFAISKNHIIVGHRETFRSSIAENFAKMNSDSDPFSLLEMALLVGESNLIVGAALACKRRLDASFPSLTDRWIAGAPVSDDIKSLLAASNPSPIIEEVQPAKVRYGFSGPWILMTGITSFCFSKSRYRADMLRDFFETDTYISGYHSVIEAIPASLSLILEILNDRPNLQPYMRDQSRARVSMEINSVKQYYEFRGTFRRALRDARRFNSYHNTRYFNGGDEHMSFLIVLTYFVSEYPEFPDFIRRYAEREPVQFEFDIGIPLPQEPDT